MKTPTLGSGVLAFVLFAGSAHAQWVMVVNNTFLNAPNNSSVALVNRSDGSLVDRNWIVPAAGAGNWNGNCSAQDAVQVGTQVWVGSSNSNCPFPAAIYIYDVDFTAAIPVATFNTARFLTTTDIGLASTQPRGLHFNSAAGIVYMSDGNGIHALDISCNYTGASLPGNCWGMTQLRTGDVAYSVIASGGIQRANATLTASLGVLVSPSSAGFWPYELDVNLAGNLVASGFSGTPYRIREWSSAGVFVSDPYPVASNLRGMSVLDDGGYLLSRNIAPFDLFKWDGVSETVIIADTGPANPAQNHFGPYMMGYLDAPTSLSLTVSQPGGAGTFKLTNDGLLTGAETFNVVSFELAPGGPGTGPYLGLHATNPANLVSQVLVPAGFEPFHFFPNRSNYSFGPIAGVPSGVSVEFVAFQIVNGMIVAVSPVASLTTQ
jgi:hypothetical protein